MKFKKRILNTGTYIVVDKKYKNIKYKNTSLPHDVFSHWSTMYNVYNAGPLCRFLLKWLHRPIPRPQTHEAFGHRPMVYKVPPQVDYFICQ